MVTIIVPVYNVEDYIENCIRSALHQTYRDIEIILVNDGSTDSSLDICKKYEKCDSRITVITRENGGLSAARNTALKAAQGEWILFLDGDDWIEEDCVQKCLEKSSDATDLVMFPYIREYQNKSRKVDLFRQSDIVFKEKKIKEYLLRRLVGPLYQKELRIPNRMEDLNPVWNKLYRRKVIGNTRFVDTQEIGTEDLWFNLLILDKSREIIFTKEIYYHYNKKNIHALTHSYNPYLFPGWKKLYGYIDSLLEQKYPDEMYQRALKNRIVINLLTLMRNIVNSDLKESEKKNEIKKVLNDEIYLDSFQEFPLRDMPFVWKSFYMACKYKSCIPVESMIRIAERLKQYS